MNLGSTGNDIDAQGCTTRGIKIETEDQAEEFKMPDGAMVRTKGESNLYSNVVGTRVKFPAGYSQYEQTNDYRNLVAIKGKPPHQPDSSCSGGEQGSSVDLIATCQTPAIKHSPSSQ